MFGTQNARNQTEPEAVFDGKMFSTFEIQIKKCLSIQTHDFRHSTLDFRLFTLSISRSEQSNPKHTTKLNDTFTYGKALNLWYINMFECWKDGIFFGGGDNLECGTKILMNKCQWGTRNILSGANTMDIFIIARITFYVHTVCNLLWCNNIVMCWW